MTQTVSLRRAAKIRNRIAARLQELQRESQSSMVRFNIHDPDFLTQVREAEEKHRAAIAQYETLSSTLEIVRIKIGQANATSGITDLLTRQAALAGRLATYRSLAMASVVPTEEQLRARVEAARNAQSLSYGASPEIASYSVLSQDTINAAAEMAHTLQKNIDLLQDALESLNATTTILLSDAELAVLQAERMI